MKTNFGKFLVGMRLAVALVSIGSLVGDVCCLVKGMISGLCK